MEGWEAMGINGILEGLELEVGQARWIFQECLSIKLDEAVTRTTRRTPTITSDQGRRMMDGQYGEEGTDQMT